MTIGTTGDDADSEIDTLLAKFDLTNKRHVLSQDLSGGMKRKLCMANAMVGGSNVRYEFVSINYKSFENIFSENISHIANKTLVHL